MKAVDAATRQSLIVEQLNQRGFLSTTALSRTLNVSDMTIRRDLRQLSKSGDVQLVHGGASLPHGTLHNADFAARANTQAQAKKQIAQRCQPLIGKGDTIIIDAGTTSFEVANQLPGEFRGTLISHSAPTMQVGLRLSQARTICLGGELLLDSQAFVGDMTISALKNLRANTVFLGTAAVHVDGIYIDRDLEGPTKRALIEAAGRVVVVATSDKMGYQAPIRLGGFAGIDMLITDAPPPPEIVRSLKESDVELVVASAEVPHS